MAKSPIPTYLQPTSTLGSGVLILHMEHVLLVRMNYGKFKGHWVQPGGKVDLGEHPEQAAIREVREETGLDVEIMDQIGVRHRIRSEGAPADVYFLFRARIPGDPKFLPKLEWPEEELMEARFWPIQEALELKTLRPMTRLALQWALKLNGFANVHHPHPSNSPDWEFDDSVFAPARLK